MIHEPIAVLPVIPADRFILRPLRKSDAGLIALYAADERVARGTAGRPRGGGLRSAALAPPAGRCIAGGAPALSLAGCARGQA